MHRWYMACVAATVLCLAASDDVTAGPNDTIDQFDVNFGGNTLFLARAHRGFREAFVTVEFHNLDPNKGGIPAANVPQLLIQTGLTGTLQPQPGHHCAATIGMWQTAMPGATLGPDFMRPSAPGIPNYSGVENYEGLFCAPTVFAAFSLGESIAGFGTGHGPWSQTQIIRSGHDRTINQQFIFLPRQSPEKGATRYPRPDDGMDVAGKHEADEDLLPQPKSENFVVTGPNNSLIVYEDCPSRAGLHSAPDPTQIGIDPNAAKDQRYIVLSKGVPYYEHRRYSTFFWVNCLGPADSKEVDTLFFQVDWGLDWRFVPDATPAGTKANAVLQRATTTVGPPTDFHEEAKKNGLINSGDVENWILQP